jgi:hypothetical protein
MTEETVALGFGEGTALQQKRRMMRDILSLDWQPKRDGQPVLGDDGPDALVCEPVPEPVASELEAITLEQAAHGWLGVMDNVEGDDDALRVEFHAVNAEGEPVALLFQCGLVELL